MNRQQNIARVAPHNDTEFRNKTNRQDRKENGTKLVQLVYKYVHEKVEHRSVNFVTRWEW
jgi:hypothetical protein